MDNLFTDNFPDVTTEKELEDLKRQYANKPYCYDIYYIVSGCIRERREKFEKLWPSYRPYCDRHFLREVKYDFHARTWEMYLGNILIQNHRPIVSSDRGPDFKIQSAPPIWVEAVVATRGEGQDAVPGLSYGVASNVPHDEMLLRLTNAFAAKFEKHQQYLNDRLIAEQDPFVIAINRGSLQHPDADIPLIWKCLFGLGYFTISINPTTGEKSSFISKREFVKKKGGTKVALGFFEKPEYRGISAVIYSTQDVLNHPDEIGSDCMIIHNQNAKNPIDEQTFNFFEQWKMVESSIIRIGLDYKKEL